MSFFITKKMSQHLQYYILLALLSSNVFWGAKVCWIYFDLQDLVESEQNQLEKVFPPLSKKEIRDYISEVYPDYFFYTQKNLGSLIRYNIYGYGEHLGYIYQIREDIYCPVCIDVRAFVVVQGHSIRDIDLINPMHLYGQTMPTQMQRVFLSQFLDRPLQKQIILGSDVDGITGATKSSQNIITGIQKISADILRE